MERLEAKLETTVEQFSRFVDNLIKTQIHSQDSEGQGSVRGDEEGMENMWNIGRNMAWVLNRLNG